MSRKRAPVTIRPSSGGRLVTNASDENVGLANYVVKTNWRRIYDREVVREGDTQFRPNELLGVTGQTLNAPSDVQGIWQLDRPNGERAVVAATRTTIYRFNYDTGTWSVVGSGYASNGQRWQADTMDGYLIFNNEVDLPFTYRVEDSAVSPIHEMREIGIAAVGTICVYNGFLLCADITEIKTAELAGVMNSGNPYAVVSSSLTNRIRYKVIWSDYAQPRNWAPLIHGTINESATDEVTLDYPVSAFPVGAKLAVVGAGPNGGVLGGQVGIDDGVPVIDINIDGNVLKLSTAAASDLDFPLSVQVTRFADTSSFVGSSSIQDDGSAILRMKPLKGSLIVYRETGIFSGRYTAVVETPFVFRREYAGRNVPFYTHAIEEVEGDYHLFATEDRFYAYDGTAEPQIHAIMDQARALFFDGLSPATFEKAFAKHNPLTHEVFFFCPNGILAFDYEQKTASFVDETYSAAAYVRRPASVTTTGPAEYWFLMVKDGVVLRYGLSNLTAGIYTRRGVPYQSILKAGLGSASDEWNEKDLLGYLPQLSSKALVDDIQVAIFGCDTARAVPEQLFSETLFSPELIDFVPTYFRNVFFQDQITALGGVRLEISARIFDLQTIDSRATVRG